MNIEKSYADCVNEISPDMLYYGLLAHGLFTEKLPFKHFLFPRRQLLAHGLFTEKLPAIFSSVAFYDYCKSKQPDFENTPQSYIYFENMRNTNVPRPFGIPTPFAYQKLCKCLADNWEQIRQHFIKQITDQPYKISRIHIRRLKDKLCLFEMNYKNWRVDGSPEADLLIGSRYLVKADISSCFPSIYTHAIPWALVGKPEAKNNQNDKSKWYNQIDHFTRNCKYGETHGLLIGPHVSNLLSEIILTVIDKHLSDLKWQYIRAVDDYTCYVASYEDAQKFLIDLNQELRTFDLLLNHKKNKIMELPIAAVEQWVRQLNNPLLILKKSIFNYKAVQAYLDSAVELMQNNEENSAILTYAIKVLGSQKLSNNAKSYCVKTFFHFAYIYQYLVSLLDEYLFIPFKVGPKSIKEFSQQLFIEAINKKNYEAVAYTIFFAVKYNFTLPTITANVIRQCKNCIVSVLAYLYFKKLALKSECKVLKEYAKELKLDKCNFEENWLFVYEVLSANDLTGEWKAIKKAGVSFLALDLTTTEKIGVVERNNVNG